MKTLAELKEWIQNGILIYYDEPKVQSEYIGMLNGVSRVEEILKPRDVHQTRPGLVNVMVLYHMHDQEFWTRGFLQGNIWKVMTWNGMIDVPFEEITYWLPLPNNL